MKNTAILGSILLTILMSSCKKDPQPTDSFPAKITGSYVSEDTVSVGPVLMYTNGYYTSFKAITDQTLIKDYLTRKGITGFVFATGPQAATSKYTIKLDYNSSSRNGTILNTTANSSIQGMLEGNQISMSPLPDSVLSFYTSDSILKASIPTDSCYILNTQASRSFLLATTAGGGSAANTTYHKRYPVVYRSGKLIINIINSYLAKSSATGSCSNYINSEWGYDYISYSILLTDHYITKNDTLVIQTRKQILNKN